MSIISFTKDFRVALDMRTSRGRRYKKVAADVIAEVGLLPPRWLRELVALRFILAETEADAISGDTHAREDWLKISDLVARREAQIREAVRTTAHAA